jgi:hypothetical protein
MSVLDHHAPYLTEGQNEPEIWLRVRVNAAVLDTDHSWDNDGTAPDPQITACVGTECNQVGHAWNMSQLGPTDWAYFDIENDAEFVSVKLTCVDDDSLADEFNNGDDACMLSDDPWFETNISVPPLIVNETSHQFFEISGSKSQSAWAAVNLSIEVVAYPDSDFDGLPDEFDRCFSEFGDVDTVDSEGCAYRDTDWDGDGLTNAEDPCHTVDSLFCGLGRNYVGRPTSLPNCAGSNFDPDFGIIISPSNTHVAYRVFYNTVVLFALGLDGSGCEFLLSDDFAHPDDNYAQSYGFSPNGRFFAYQGHLKGGGSHLFVFDVTTKAYLVEEGFFWTGKTTDEGGCTNGGEVRFGIQFSADSSRLLVPCHQLPTTGFLTLDLGRDSYSASDMEFHDVLPTNNNTIGDWQSESVVTGYRPESVYAPSYLSDWTFDGPVITVVHEMQDKAAVLINRECEEDNLNLNCADFIIINKTSGATHTLLENRQGHGVDLPGGTRIGRPYSGQITFSMDGSLLVVRNHGIWYRDLDGDGVADLVDDCIFTAGPQVGCPDADDDGVPDERDLCPNSAGPSNSDGCDAAQRDSDLDGVNDASDLCPGTSSTESTDSYGCSDMQVDSDNDGVVDGLDACPSTAVIEVSDEQGCSPSQKDSDGDGVVDSADLCENTDLLATVNSDGCALYQLDSDADGVNDLLDVCDGTGAYGTVDENGCSDFQLDSDADGVADAIDNCPETSAGLTVNASGCSDEQIPLQDSDGDGFSDTFETSELGTSPTSHDTDNDGLSDYDEVFIYGTNPNSADSDGDSRSDAQEVNDGTNPNAPDGQTSEAGGGVFCLLLLGVISFTMLWGKVKSQRKEQAAMAPTRTESNSSQSRTEVNNSESRPISNRPLAPTTTSMPALQSLAQNSAPARRTEPHISRESVREREVQRLIESQQSAKAELHALKQEMNERLERVSQREAELHEQLLSQQQTTEEMKALREELELLRAEKREVTNNITYIIRDSSIVTDEFGRVN